MDGRIVPLKREDVMPGIKVVHKRHKVVKTVAYLCKTREPDGNWVDGVVYAGMDRYSGCVNMFCRPMESMLENFDKLIEHEQEGGICAEIYTEYILG